MGPRFGDLVFVIECDRIRIKKWDDGRLYVRFIVDPTKSPKSIDIFVSDLKEKKSYVLRGVYTMENDVLQILLGRAGSPRPEKLKSPSKNAYPLLVLKRLKKQTGVK
jgi:uncharacterized protein (TIGR03067 family)